MTWLSENLDLKDRKILYQLDLDSRQFFRSLGKKVGLSKDVVGNRVKRLQEDGIIICFWTAIDTYKLGYQVYRIYINFRILHLKKSKNNSTFC